MRSSRIALLILFVLFTLSVPSVFAQVETEVAFESLFFSNPVDIQHPGDGTNRLFLVQQNDAQIWVFPDDLASGDASLFLDLSDRVRTAGGEEGLLGLAFHPNYESNGYFYVYYSASSPRRSVIERFTVSSSNPDQANQESGLVIMEVDQPYENHNGGQLAFGPDDGYLYIALGDGGSGGDPQGHGQNRETLLGNILRIDVDGTSNGLNYRIPSDNPYAGNTQNFREEIFAYGFRNPWRMSFDAPTGQLWVADVGQNEREEVAIVANGENHGWKIMEGFQCYPSSANCNPEGLTLPVWDYGRSLGASVTGGHVYRGSRISEYTGFYIYSDFISGRIWALKYIEGQPTTHFEIHDLPHNVAAFGVSATGELYMLAFNGRIYQFTSEGLPVASFETGPPSRSTVNANSASFSWRADDADGSIVDYEIDLDGPTTLEQTTTETSITLNNLANGDYSFCVTAQDNNGNNSQAACTSFTVDAVSLPVVQIDAGPADGSTINTGVAQFAWSGSHPAGTIAQYEIDLSGPLSESFQTTDTEATFTPLTNGNYTFCVRAQDTQGLWSEQACVDFSVDLSVDNLTPPIAAFLNGTLPRLTPDDSGEPDRTAPDVLSAIDAFANLSTLDVVEGLIPYAPIQPFWSDGALKQRWMAIPNDGIPDTDNERIGYSPNDSWSFPVGTVFVKHFELDIDEPGDGPLNRLETRFMAHGEDGNWYGLTYRWRADRTDADLVGVSGSSETLTITTAQGTREQTWTYPGRLDCQGCHAPGNGPVLGANARQLNHDLYFPDADTQNNQIVELHRRGFINSDPIDTGSLTTLTPITDTQAPVEDRIRSYLDVNCGYCHKEGGTGKGLFDARYTVAPENQNIVDGSLIDGMGIDGARVVVPGDSMRSVAYLRMTSLFEEVMMPPLAKNRVDAAAISLMQTWIEGLGELPVELTRFEGIQGEDGVHLSWTTASEKNNAGFSIERQIGYGTKYDLSPDQWASIGFVTGYGTTAATTEYTYQDSALPESGIRLFYRLKQIDFDGTFAYSDIVSIDLLTPVRFELHSNYPNPFNPSTTISYDLPVESHVELSIFDTQGRHIQTLVDQPQKAGRYSVAFDADNLVTGLYLYRLRAGNNEKTGQMMFVK